MGRMVWVWFVEGNWGQWITLGCLCCKSVVWRQWVMRGSGVIRRVGSCSGVVVVRVVVRGNSGVMSCDNMVWFGRVVGCVYGMLMMGCGCVM